jgi:hypothetical protein
MYNFYEACIIGNVERVREIIANPDFDVNYVNRRDHRAFSPTGLSKAISCSNVDVVRILLEHPNINVNENRYGDTPLKRTIMRCSQRDDSNMQILRMLLAHQNIDVNCMSPPSLFSESWETPLISATYANSNEVVALLLEHPNIDVHMTDPDGFNALDIAIETQHNDIATMLQSRMGLLIDEGPIEVNMSVPLNTEDAIYGVFIENGCVMADFHGEREFGGYYTKASYDAMQPKRNPMTRQPILRSEVVFYIADVSTT